MNKTVNINLGGIFYHIDEDAYQKLSRYFDAIKRSLSNSSGQDEIIKDIEMRVSELLGEKQKSEKHVVALKDVDEVIAVMGQPEDYRIDDDGTEPKTTNFYTTSKSRKLYRDKESGIIGGVLAGLGHYFGIDKVWLRVIMLILLFSFGTGFLLYIILWIVMPEAVTTSEKLEMTGEPVNISNIEKKVREEFDNLSEKFKNSGEKLSDEAKNFNAKYGEKINYQAKNIGSSLGDFIIGSLKVFAKLLGVFVIMAGVGILIAFLIGSITLGSTGFANFPFHTFIESGNLTDYPVWIFGILLFLAIGIPAFLMILLGLKIINPNIKSIGNIAKYALFALWIIAVAFLTSIGINQINQVAYENKTVQKQEIAINPTDTLFVKFRYNDYYTKDVNDRDDIRIVQDSANNDLIYSNNVYLKVLHTDKKMPYIQIEKTANGKSFTDAKQRAEKIKYAVKIEGNHLILDNYLLTDAKNKFRGQEVNLFLYLPEGLLLKTDTSVEEYDNSDNDYFNLHFSSDKYIYKVGKSQIKCLNCPVNEDEYNDVENDSITDDSINVDINTPNVTINKNGISIKNDSTKSHNKDFKELKIDKNGIIIKTH